jgi:hypothetical protein
MEVGRSCNASILQRTGALLTGLSMASAPGAGAGTGAELLPDASLPLNCINALPHLMCPGTMFSLRPAAILAMLALTTGCLRAAFNIIHSSSNNNT